MKQILFLFILLLGSSFLFSQQVADTSFRPPIHQVAYPTGKGPVVFIDAGHHNFHTKEGRYKAFANLLEQDGYVLRSHEGTFTQDHLQEGKILVISNALNEQNVQDWFLPNPSAFTKAEIAMLESWVSSGGNLFLIADHMPLAGAATDLASAFGFEFTNGFVVDTISSGPAFFRKSDKSLHHNLITKGRSEEEEIDQIATFTGQAFRIPPEATPILTFGEGFINLLPDTAWVFHEQTPRLSAKGWHQGAYKQHGGGRIVVFGEAAMFSAQLAGPQRRKMGMNNEVAKENYQLLLNIIHWLDGLLE